MFLRKVANKQTNRQTNNDDYISSFAEVIKYISIKPMWAHWRHLANTIERVLLALAHPSPQPK